MASLNDGLSFNELTTELEGIVDEYWSFLSRSRKVRYINHSCKKLLLTGIKDHFFNGVISFRCEIDDTQKEVAKTLGFFYSHRIPMTWWITPSTKPVNLQMYLHRFGLNFLESYPGMIIDLSESLKEEIDLISDIKIESVRTVDKLSDWTMIYQIGFQASEETSSWLFEVYKDLGIDQKQPLQHFIGYSGHLPVAISSVFFGRSVAGIWNVCTHPKHRRKGFGRAITIAPLVSALERRYQRAGLFATEEGFSVYKNIGFRSIMMTTHYISRW